MEQQRQLRIVGIDPGQKGGLALLVGGALQDGIRMPMLKHRSKLQLDAPGALQWLTKAQPDIIVIEAVHAMPKQGVSSTFQFGRSFGAVEAVATLVGCRLHDVTPTKWKGAMGLSRDKRASFDAGRRLFGNVFDLLCPKLVDEGIAEAALIASYWFGIQQYTVGDPTCED